MTIILIILAAAFVLAGGLRDWDSAAGAIAGMLVSLVLLFALNVLP